MTPGVYVYGVVETGSLTGIGAEGIGGGPPALFCVGDLAAIVCGVDVGEFEGETLERNVSSPEWLGQKVRAHEAVLEEAIAATSVVPMRFGSIFSSAAGVQRMLSEQAAEFRAALGRVRGRTEWGVKLHCDAARVVESLAGAPEASSGRGYLEQRKAQLDARARAAEVAADAAARTHRSLAELADEAVVASARSGEILNGAYLVHDGRRTAFMRRVEDLQDGHAGTFVFEVTGPWPPYNFTDADVGGVRP